MNKKYKATGRFAMAVRMIAWAAIALSGGGVSGCGGGSSGDSDTPTNASIGAQGTVPLRVAALASVPIEPTTLFDWATGAYSAYFYGTHVQGEAFVAGFGTFLYRQWPSTGNYLGVVEGKVYAYGPVTGWQIQNVGLVEDFRCAVTDCAGTGTAPLANVALSRPSTPQGQAVELSWNSQNAYSCTGSWSGALALQGKVQLVPDSVGPKTYSLNCTGVGGQASKETSLLVTQAVGGTGATLPYIEFEAEDLAYRGVLLGPTRAAGEIASEASGRQAVKLGSSGDFVQFTTTRPVNSIVVRYSIPDSATGTGATATLGLYVDGRRVRDLQLTSRYTWVYGGYTNSRSKNPADGGAHHFFDEVRLLIGDIPAGALVKLQKDSVDTASSYVIDLIDVEQVASPLAQPADSLSILDFGAVADDNSDDSLAIQRAIEAAQRQSKSVWIPRGTFDLNADVLTTSGITIQGAGMWYSVLTGGKAHFSFSGNNNHFKDFALTGDITYRDDTNNSHDGFRGSAGAGSSFTNLWIEHVKAGIWLAEGSSIGIVPTTGLVARGLRIRNTYADGINFCCGTSNSIVEQSSFRGTGDDAVASWSFSNLTRQWPANSGNVFRFNTIQSIWKANCIGIYGGGNIEAHDNYCADTASYSGIRVGSEFSSEPFSGTVTISNNSVVRAGGPYGGGLNGAVTILALQSPASSIVLKNLLILDSTYAGIQIQGPFSFGSIQAENTVIQRSGTNGVWMFRNAAGTFKATYLLIGESAGPALRQDSATSPSVEKGTGNFGW